MQRTGILLLLASAVLAIGSLAGGLVRAHSASEDLLAAFQEADTPTPDHFVYLPLVTGNAGPAWETIVEEGFETPQPPNSLWSSWSWDGSYSWARRNCRPYGGDYSAWAVGGGSSGATLPCASNYPNNVDSWIGYGPFSLEDATAATLNFQLWMNVGGVQWDYNDYLAIWTSTDGETYDKGKWLTYQPTDWAPVTFHLDNDTTGINMLGKPQVWVALNFVSNGTANFPEGAYVDDVTVRKCVGGICPAAMGAGAGPANVQMRPVPGIRVRPGSILPAKRQQLK